MESGARRLLRRLMAAGVKDFDALKDKLDACGGGSIDPATGRKPPMTPNAAGAFLEQVGLWDEAKALRLRVQKGADQRRTKHFRERVLAASKVRVAKANSNSHSAAKPQDKLTEVKPEIKLEDGKPQVGDADMKTHQELPDGRDVPAAAKPARMYTTLRRLRRKSSDPGYKEWNTGTSSSSTDQGCAGQLKEEAADCSMTEGIMDADGTAGPYAPRSVLPSDDKSLASLIEPRSIEKETLRDMAPKKSSSIASRRFELAWERDPLVKVMQAVYGAASACEAQDQLFLSPYSADEEALKTLACQSQKIVPALAQLRRKAVDRAILMTGDCCKDGQVVKEDDEEDEHVDSDGESSAVEFGVSDSDGEDGPVRPKSLPPLVLPPGWRTEMFRRKGRQCREFVGPNGRRYRTKAEAHRVINLQRTRENLVQQIRSKYTATTTKKLLDTTPEKVKRPSRFADEHPLLQSKLRPCGSSGMEVDHGLAVAQETDVPESERCNKRLRNA